MNRNYNLLMAKRINMIKQDLNEEYIRKFNLSVDTIKRKKRKKLSIKELDELKYIITDLQKIPKDEKFQDYVLRHLKIFLIYGNTKLIGRNDIVLELTSNQETYLLYINIDKNCINTTLKTNDYREESTFKTLENGYYTNYKRKERSVYKNRHTSFHTINLTEDFHGFHNNKEVITRLTSTHDNYIKNNLTQEISRKGLNEDNYKDITTYYRKDGYIVKKQKRKYKSKKIGRILDYEQYQISEDYCKSEKYLSQIGQYKKFAKKLYLPFLREKCPAKTLYQ